MPLLLFRRGPRCNHVDISNPSDNFDQVAVVIDWSRRRDLVALLDLYAQDASHASSRRRLIGGGTNWKSFGRIGSMATS